MLTTTRLIASFAVATVALASAPAAQARSLSDAERASNTYQTYAPGQGGCVDDFGYGRVRGCD